MIRWRLPRLVRFYHKLVLGSHCTIFTRFIQVDYKNAKTVAIIVQHVSLGLESWLQQKQTWTWSKWDLPPAFLNEDGQSFHDCPCLIWGSWNRTVGTRHKGRQANHQPSTCSIRDDCSSSSSFSWATLLDLWSCWWTSPPGRRISNVLFCPTLVMDVKSTNSDQKPGCKYVYLWLKQTTNVTFLLGCVILSHYDVTTLSFWRPVERYIAVRSVRNIYQLQLAYNLLYLLCLKSLSDMKAGKKTEAQRSSWTFMSARVTDSPQSPLYHDAGMASQKTCQTHKAESSELKLSCRRSTSAEIHVV